MVKKKKSKLGSFGPAAHWLRLSVADRAKTKEYIKAGLLGHERDGVAIPSARRIFKGLGADAGYDLRHIERWSAARLKHARTKIQMLNTLTSRPFAVVIPRTAKQRKEAQKFTGQNLPTQREMIVPVQMQGKDKAVFRNGKLAIERKFPGGSKTLKQRFLFADYLRPDETLKERLAESLEDELSEEDIEKAYGRATLEAPSTFREMQAVTKRMMLDMPEKVYGQDAFYTLLTLQYGPIGRSAVHERIPELLAIYFNRYDPGGTQYKGHEDFAEQVIGFQLVGTFAQMSAYEIERDRLSCERKRKGKLRFSKRAKSTGRR